MLNLLMSVGAHWSALSDEISWELLLQIIGALSVAVVATRLFVFAVKLAWTPSGVNVSCDCSVTLSYCVVEAPRWKGRGEKEDGQLGR